MRLQPLFSPNVNPPQPPVPIALNASRSRETPPRRVCGGCLSNRSPTGGPLALQSVTTSPPPVRDQPLPALSRAIASGAPRGSRGGAAAQTSTFACSTAAFALVGATHRVFDVSTVVSVTFSAISGRVCTAAVHLVATRNGVRFSGSFGCYLVKNMEILTL